jgi:aminomethyltransferase
MTNPSVNTDVTEASATDAPLHSTPLVDAHRALGARMVPFAGYLMPVQYPDGILAEHVWTRTHAGLFDVSHMGQAIVAGPDHATTAAALERLVPGDIAGLAPGRIRYTQLLTPEGGIVDDLMVTRPADPAEDGRLFLVVNASRKEGDFALIAEGLPAGITLTPMPEKALLALQGPEAAAVMRRLSPTADDLAFMAGGPATVAGFACHVSRSGYTGEDGFEISVDAADVVALWQALLADPAVKPVGLGARDSLRLEAGLCLYGHDIDETTSPVEAALVWSIGKRRREEGGFPGDGRIRRELADGPARKRVGLKPEGRAPAREGTEIHVGGRQVGIVTSGGFGPTVSGPVAMGYVETAFAATGTEVTLIVRGKPLPARVVTLPFVPARYKR